MATWFTDDITWCASKCNRKSCYRHPSNMRDRTGLHSYAEFKGTKDCVKEKEKKNAETSVSV